ncbi:MAG TPA: DUF4147 domain-containing protein [Acidimicrobiales bacterium]|nr:DUF4147 domain-containing protein [Acidimicrobiales bacterium]
MGARDNTDARSLVTDARSIATRWRDEMDLRDMTGKLLEDSGVKDLTLDVVAIGKASLEMTAAVVDALGESVHRGLAVCDDTAPRRSASITDVVVGDHPVPGEGSLRAGMAVFDFLSQPSDADVTLFLISGGASSLCVAPAPPVTLDDLAAVWRAALRSGVDITALNMIRAASSLIAGGAVLRRVSTARSQSFILVDNVVSGAEWVASAMTYEFRPSESFVAELWHRIGIADRDLRGRLLAGFETRSAIMANVPDTRHENAVLADPAMMLESAINQAERLGYEVLNMGADISGDVENVVAQWSSVIDSAPTRPVALVGAGEVTVKVRGDGEGGRCQEFAWLMASVLDRAERDGVFVAQSSDGRDHVEGVGGAWVDRATSTIARDHGIDWAAVAASHDTYPALKSIGRLIEGEHTGWNLCDLYVAVLA